MKQGPVEITFGRCWL